MVIEELQAVVEVKAAMVARAKPEDRHLKMKILQLAIYM